MPLWFLASLKQFYFRLLTPSHHTIQGSPRTPPFEDFHIVKRARMKLPRGYYTEGQGQTRGLRVPNGPRHKDRQGGFTLPYGNRLAPWWQWSTSCHRGDRGTDSGKAVLCRQNLALLQLLWTRTLICVKQTCTVRICNYCMVSICYFMNPLTQTMCTRPLLGEAGRGELAWERG